MHILPSPVHVDLRYLRRFFSFKLFFNSFDKLQIICARKFDFAAD